jgi:hypothetical protein
MALNFNSKYVTYMKLNQAKSTMGGSFSNGLVIGKMYAFQWTVVKSGIPAEKKRNLENWSIVTPGYGTCKC